MTQQHSEASEVDVLHPERRLTLGGKDIIVREFSFLEGLEASAIAAGLLRDFCRAAQEQEEALDYLDIERIFAAHQPEMLTLLSMTTGESQEWIRSLNDEDGQTLMLGFWGANSAFFTRRLVSNLLIRRETARAVESVMPSSAAS